ncbi:hypothetical protein AMTRI_Chr01g133270 [Amborella trichopoda]
MLSRMKRSDHFSGFNIANSGIIVSHLQYADNTLIFCDANPLHVRNIVRFLEVCEVIIGFKVNFNKSSMVSINCFEALTASLASVMECKVGSFPLTYLGLLISDSRLTIAVCDKVLERIQFKLDLWKNKHLSSCLSNLPIYQMSLINMPASVVRKIEKMMRDFLWGSYGDSRKFHLLRWERVCTPKKEGGLWIRHVRFVNQALLCKWWWRSIHFNDHLWYQVLLSKYGLDRSELWLGGGRGRNTSKMWRSIANCRFMILGYFRWNVGCGDRVFFWHHKWVDEFNLKSLFLEPFGIVWRPNMKVSEVVEPRGVYISPNAEDEMVWEIECAGVFSIKSCYNLLFYDRWQWSCTQIAQIWKWAVPHEVQVFIWLVTLNKILTTDNLIKKGKILPNVCLFCKADGESVAHLLIQCPFTVRIWYWLIGVLNINLVLLQYVEGIVTQLSLPHLPKVGNVI